MKHLLKHKSVKSSLFLLGLMVITFTSCTPGKDQQQVKQISENGKSYLVQDSLLVQTPDGAEIAVIVVRNADITQKETAILYHTIYARATDISRAKLAADKGYVGVVSYTRGKGWSNSPITPYEMEPSDVNTVIEWISQQAWSNGKVGMYGGSYVGFVQWAATKKLHPALKTIVPSVSVAPGIAEPMENGVYANFHYPWYHYVTNNRMLDTLLYNNHQRWNNLYREYYEKGTSYRSLDSLDGLQNPFFRSRLDHQEYDTYWQSMIPYQKDFANINIPVLSTTGYYDGGQIGSLYYLKEHYKYNSNAEHYLIIGPYGHFGAQGTPDAEIMGYSIDPVAKISIKEIIFEWFDYIFKDATKPEILKDKINYQIMGTNTWGHVASLSEMARDTLTLYLSSPPSGIGFKPTYPSYWDETNEYHKLVQAQPEVKNYIEQTVDFADRSMFTQHNYFTPLIENDSLPLGNGIAFASAPFEKDAEINGAFTGILNIELNKKDLDYSMVLYEQTPEGTYFELTLAHVGRVSMAKDRTRRQLLFTDTINSIPIGLTRMTSKKIKKGSRIILVLNVNKHPYEEVNYGTGRDVAGESIKDAGNPLKVRWYNSSFIKIPVSDNVLLPDSN